MGRSNFSVVPPWVIVMYNTIFFENCVSHPDEKKNELDRFCIDCLKSFCSHCLSSHALHKHIKTYHTNKAKVLFLKQRTQSHQQQQRSNSRDCRCSICDKGLQDNTSLYCSIACKVLDIHRDEESEETSNHKLMGCLQHEEDDQEIYVRLPLTKKPRLRQTRKGVPLRSPMF
ncbi:hypothetical protein V6N12_020690 [Hibiscus sabdariffa]|uniref:Uncharacterized protein n=1 Tax=Hibiscus sabdariffa TaxID=183260 RepID=A0ABR2CYW2_9ROSI